jgi:hypothetical protein
MRKLRNGGDPKKTSFIPSPSNNLHNSLNLRTTALNHSVCANVIGKRKNTNRYMNVAEIKKTKHEHNVLSEKSI